MRDVDGIDRDLDASLLRQLSQTRQLRLHQRVGDQHIIAGQHLRLAQLGDRDPDCALIELHLGNLGDLVGLHVGPELDTPRTTLLLHRGDVVLEDVQIDVEGRCVEVERVH